MFFCRPSVFLSFCPPFFQPLSFSPALISLHFFFLSSSRIWHILKNYISYAYNKTAIVHIGRVDRGNSEIQPDSFGSCYCWVHRVWLLTHWHTLLSPSPLGWNQILLDHAIAESIGCGFWHINTPYWARTHWAGIRFFWIMLLLSP